MPAFHTISNSPERELNYEPFLTHDSRLLFLIQDIYRSRRN